jgi:hypothetical protein
MIAIAAPPVDVASPSTGIFILVGIIAGLKIVFEQWLFDKKREKRRTYYRVTYLKSDDWKKKRAVVLNRDGYRCQCCGGRATHVHHKKYARRNIGKEPIEWLVAVVCKSCHERQHE